MDIRVPIVDETPNHEFLWYCKKKKKHKKEAQKHIE